LVGSAIGGSNGTAGFAKTTAEESEVLTKITREIFPAKISFAKQYFHEILKERSDLSMRTFFNTFTEKFTEFEFSQTHISIGISSRVNALKPFKLQALF
jgi:hypothetical protein